MAGYNYEAGRSNNMVTAEANGSITVGRWGKKFGVSAAAVRFVMKPHEAHHTGTGRVGKSQLTYVLDRNTQPSDEQRDAMKEYDRRKKAGEPQSDERVYEGCTVRYITFAKCGRSWNTNETIERDARVTMKIDDYSGSIVGMKGRDRNGLLVLDADANVLIDRVDAQYDDSADIVARLTGEAVAAATTLPTPPIASPEPKPVETVDQNKPRDLTPEEVERIESADLTQFAGLKGKQLRTALYEAGLPQQSAARAMVIDRLAG